MLSFCQPALRPPSFFFFNDTATTEIYTLSLHDALPISRRESVRARAPAGEPGSGRRARPGPSPRGGPAHPSARLLCGGPEHLPQLGEGEGLVEVGATEALEEAEGVAAHRVTGGEDDALGRAGVLTRQLVVHVAAAEVGHPQVADDDVEGPYQRALERVLAVARHLDRVPPALERGAHEIGRAHV